MNLNVRKKLTLSLAFLLAMGISTNLTLAKGDKDSSSSSSDDSSSSESTTEETTTTTEETTTTTEESSKDSNEKNTYERKDMDLDQLEKIITTLNLLERDDHGQINHNQPVTRGEFIATVVSKLVAHNEDWDKYPDSPFSDVSEQYWASAYIAYALEKGYISGYDDNTFRPEETITLGQASVVIANILDYDKEIFTDFSLSQRVDWMKEEGFLSQITTSDANDTLTNQDVMYLIYNILPANGGGNRTNSILEDLGFQNDHLDNHRDLEREQLSDYALHRGNISSDLPVALRDIETFLLNEEEVSSYRDIPENSVLYWLEHTKSLWAYDNSVTGMIESISDNTITILGTAYTVDDEEALANITDRTYRVGSVVTANLGKDNTILHLYAPNTGTSTVAGMITDISTTTRTDAIGEEYEAPSVTLYGTDGRSYTFPVNRASYITEGAILEVQSDGDGTFTLNNYRSTRTIRGIVNEDATMLGDSPLASDIQIMDTYTGYNKNSEEYVAEKVILDKSRIIGIDISADQIAYHSTNAKGEIDRLILKDTTGDLHEYALLLKHEVTNSTTSKYAVTYTYVPEGKNTAQEQEMSTYFPVSSGAILVKGGISKNADNMTNLKEGKVNLLESNQLTIGETIYPFAEEMICFEKQGMYYYASTVHRLMEDEITTLTAYYNSESDNLIRILLGEVK